MITQLNQVDKNDPSHTDELWEAFKNEGCPIARDALVKQYMPLVRHIAKRAIRSMPQTVDIDDMVSAGYLGLLDAMAAYDPHRGIRFTTFCSFRVRGAIIDELRSMDFVSRSVRSHARKIDRATNRVANRIHRPPTDGELAEEMHIDETACHKMRREARPPEMVSLDAGNPSAAGEHGCWAETLGDKHQATPLGEALRGEFKEYICDNLSKSQRLVVTLYYFEGMTMQEIGQSLDLSESRVSQVHASVLAKLRDLMNPNKPVTGRQKNNPQGAANKLFFKAA